MSNQKNNEYTSLLFSYHLAVSCSFLISLIRFFLKTVCMKLCHGQAALKPTKEMLWGKGAKIENNFNPLNQWSSKIFPTLMLDVAADHIR